VVAVTWKDPIWEFALTAIAATPVLSVVTVGGPEKLTLAPLDGAVKVTAAPGMAFPSASCTLAFSALA
jgi:hypothetical protein